MKINMEYIVGETKNGKMVVEFRYNGEKLKAIPVKDFDEAIFIITTFDKVLRCLTNEK